MDAMRPTLDSCTACTICMTHCPVAKATPRYRGPKTTGPAYERFRLLGLNDDASLDYCSNCKNCDIVCPSGVPVSTLNMKARAAYCRRRPPKFRDRLLGHSGALGKLASLTPAPLLNMGMHNPLSRWALDLLGIEKQAPLPSFGSLHARRALRRPHAARQAAKQLVFFPGCFISYYEPNLGLDIIRILEKAGYQVTVPESFVCCGLPLIANGFAAHALRHARANSAQLARQADAGIPVIAACPSCTLMLSREYGELFPEEELGRHGGIVQDACAFIEGCLARGEILPSATAPERRLAYHAPCHLRAQGEGRSGLALLRRLPGVSVTDMDAGCCGIAGSYGFKKDKYAIAMQVGAPLFNALRNSDASLGVSECGVCRVQMRHGSSLPAVHPLSILAQRL